MTFVYYELQHYTPAFFFSMVKCLQKNKQTNKQTNKQNQRKTITTTYLRDKCFIDKIPFIKGLSIFVSISSHEYIFSRKV